MQSKWAPPGTRLATIADLVNVDNVDEKVRFFGIVQRFDANSATLLLTARETATAQLDRAMLRGGAVTVDISVPLAETTHNLVAVGTRLLIVGNVVSRLEAERASAQAGDRQETQIQWELRHAGARIKAILLQDAGRTQSADWEEAVETRRKAQEAIIQAREAH